MTKKKKYKKRPGPKLSLDDRLRVELAAQFKEADPKIGAYEALRHACVIHPDNLPLSLSAKLQNVPKTWNVAFEKYLNKDELDSFQVEINRLSKALAKERDWFVDTTCIEGAPNYDPDSVTLNLQMSKDKNQKK